MVCFRWGLLVQSQLQGHYINRKRCGERPRKGHIFPPTPSPLLALYGCYFVHVRVDDLSKDRRFFNSLCWGLGVRGETLMVHLLSIACCAIAVNCPFTRSSLNGAPVADPSAITFTLFGTFE